MLIGLIYRDDCHLNLKRDIDILFF